MDLLHAFRRLRYALALAVLAGVANLLLDVLIVRADLPAPTRNLVDLITGATFVVMAALALWIVLKNARLIAERARSDQELLRQTQEAERALRLSETRFRLIASNVPAGISLIDRDLRYRYANARSEEWLGVKADQIAGMHVRDVIGEAGYEQGLPHMLAALAGQQQTFENVLQGRRGVAVPVLINFVPYSAEGKVEGFYVLMTDISAVKRAEENLVAQARTAQEQLAELEAIYDTAHVGLAVLDTDFRFVRVNQRMAEMNGVPHEEHTGRTLHEVVPGVAGQAEAIIRQIVETGEPVLDVEINGETNAQPGVNRAWIERWLPLRDADGRIFAVNVVVEEVTEIRRFQQEQERLLAEVQDQRRRAQTLALALQDERDVLETIMENTRTQLAYLDPVFNFVRVNSAYARHAHLSRDALIGRNHFSLFPDDESQAIFEEVWSTGEPAEYRGRPMRTPSQGDGRVTYWDWTLVPVKNERGQTQGLVFSLTDVTEQKCAEEVLRNARDELEQAVQARTRELAEREEQYRSIFEATSDGLVILNRQGLVVDANPAATMISGYTREELTRLDPTALIVEGQREAFDEFLRRSYEAGRVEASTIGVRRNGETYDMEVRAARFTYRGEPHLLGIVRDITERVRSIQLLEARVKERTRELSTLLDVSRAISATLEQRTLLSLVADQMQELLPQEAVLLYLFREDQLVLAEHRGFERNRASDEAIALTDPRMLNEARRQEAPYVLADLGKEDQHGFAASVRARVHSLLPAARGMMWAPLCVKGRVVGGLGVVSNEACRFAPRDAELLATVANQAAVALDNARLYEQAQELAILQERQRLARELHDSVTQALYSLVLMTEATRRLMIQNQTERITVFLGRIAETAQQVLKEMRLLVYELRPTILARDGLISALRQRLHTVEGRAGVDAKLLVTGNAYVPDSIEAELYRVAQEALNNSLKHSGATAVVVQLNLEGEAVCLSIRDNGRGFDPEHITDGGMGLNGMKERAQRLGGKLEVASNAGQGTTVTLEIPLPAYQEE